MARTFAIAVVLSGAAAAACGSPGKAGPDAPGGSAIDAPNFEGDAPPGQTAPHPFGTHGGYVTAGVIFPSNHSQAELDAATADDYDTWKATYLVAGCNPGEYRVKSTPSTSAYDVSEGHGYGMLIAAIMEGHDPDAHKIFDGLYHFYDKHRSQNDSNLMAWAQDQACAPVDGADSATDGDLDVAYALLLADRQWGSSGAIDYHAAALKIIASILASDIHPTGSILVGDWAGSGDSHYTGTRPSDFMIDHFRAFGAASGVARWHDVVEHTHAVVQYLQHNSALATGLLPDFAVNAAGANPMPTPAPSGWLESANDGRYGYNSCRVPWHLATDYLMYGEPRAQAEVRTINAWIRGKTGDDPGKIVDGYALDGTAKGGGASNAFAAPFAVAAMVEPASGSNQPWLDASWDEVANQGPGDYFSDTLRLLGMIVMSGNWWKP
jgi:endo-1,4-beta-D-glucanase Y